MLAIPPRAWMNIDHGTVIEAGEYNGNDGYFVYIEHGDHRLAVYESALKLVHRPQPTDSGAEEYDDIMAAQTLMDQS